MKRFDGRRSSTLPEDLSSSPGRGGRSPAGPKRNLVRVPPRVPRWRGGASRPTTGGRCPRGSRSATPRGVSFVEEPVPLDSVGVYVPGGRAFYPSSLLMGVVPARVAGVPRDRRRDAAARLGREPRAPLGGARAGRRRGPPRGRRARDRGPRLRRAAARRSSAPATASSPPPSTSSRASCRSTFPPARRRSRSSRLGRRRAGPRGRRPPRPGRARSGRALSALHGLDEARDGGRTGRPLADRGVRREDFVDGDANGPAPRRPDLRLPESPAPRRPAPRSPPSTCR